MNVCLLGDPELYCTNNRDDFNKNHNLIQLFVFISTPNSSFKRVISFKFVKK